MRKTFFFCSKLKLNAFVYNTIYTDNLNIFFFSFCFLDLALERILGRGRINRIAVQGKLCGGGEEGDSYTLPA